VRRPSQHRMITLLLGLMGMALTAYAATDTPKGETEVLRGFGNGYRGYALEVNGEYRYNTVWGHHGNFGLIAGLPFHPNFEMSVRAQASTTNVYAIATTLRPMLDIRVGQLFMDADVVNNWWVRNNQVSVTGALSLGWRMDYISVELGACYRAMQWINTPAQSSWQWISEPIGLVYRLEVYCRPRTSDWNIWLSASNKEPFAIERDSQPTFHLGTWWDVSAHWRLSLTGTLEPTGILHMNTVFYSAGIMAGGQFTF